MTEVTLADAYREACTALGEAVVQQRLLTRCLAELEQANVATPTEEADVPPVR